MIAPAPDEQHSRTVLIIAGSLRQCLKWVEHEKLDKNQCRFVSCTDNLEGVRDVRIVWVGTFWERHDFDQLCSLVDRLVAAGMAVVDRNEVPQGRKTRKKTNPESGANSGPLS